MRGHARPILCAVIALLLAPLPAAAQYGEPPGAAGGASEADYYRIESIPIPEGVVLEAGGLALLPDDRLAVSTRRGEIWILTNPYMRGGELPHFERFARGLHEPVGLAYKDGAFYASQRGEMTRMRDLDGDGVADTYDTVYAWPQSANHHAFSFGPKVLPDGRLWVTLNLDSPALGMTRHSSLVKWRGWTAAISDDGSFEPIATGLKAPAGYGLNAEGDMFFSENDGLWVGSGYVSHIEKGDFLGHPAGLKWKDLPESPVEMEISHLDMPSTGRPMYELARDIPAWKLPAVWLPKGVLGSATMDILVDTTGGRFGPFQNQLFVGDHTHNALFRIFLEKVDGEYQGAAFPFRKDFMTGLVRQVWGRDGSMFVGMTDRGWSKGAAQPYALQRVIWTGETPFEIRAIRAKSDGFELEFTKPADPADLNDPALYHVKSFTYKYHDEYASPVVNAEDNPILGVRASDDGTRVRLVIDNLREYHIHEVKLGPLDDSDGVSLLHDLAYYTLNNIPDGDRLPLSEAVRPAPDERAASESAQHAGDEASQEASDGAAEQAGDEAAQHDDGDAGPPPREAFSRTMPATWTDAPDVSLVIGTEPGLRFDVESFDVPPSARVRLTFENEDDMLHNLVIVSPGTGDDVGRAAMNMGLDGEAMDYVPEMEEVMYYTTILQPGESESIFFTAPEDPGVYPYICSFPGHYVSMRGVMNVVRQ